MVRNRIFISYSHKDKEFFDELLIYLKPWQDRCIYDVWTDQAIRSGQDWHQEIQQAIDSTAVAVLLTSQYFMASDYIRDYEVPLFLKACEKGKLTLTCLHLWKSSVDQHPFAVTLDNGQTRDIKLSRYQSLNDPKEPLASQSKARQNEIFDDAVRKIEELYERYAQKETPKPPATGQRRELTIRLEISREQLYRTFYGPQSRIATGHSAWPALRERLQTWKDQGPAALEDAVLGSALYETLFGAGPEEKTGEVLQPLFNTASVPNPILKPVRVRIQTTEALLAELPWPQTTWNGKRLWEDGWTFELIGAATVDDIADFPDLRLKAPCPVLLLAPQPGGYAHLGSEYHLLALEGRLDHTWPVYRERLPHVKTRAQLTPVLQQHTPRIIYFYGPARQHGNTVQLRLEDESLDVTELLGLCSKPPGMLFLNLLEDEPLGLGTLLASLPIPVPLVITQTWSSSDPVSPRQAAKAWFLELLKGSEIRDPVALLHEHGLCTALAWARYRHWHYEPPGPTVPEKLARLLLDRENQRRSVQGVVSTLVNDPGRRLSCLLAYGDEGNLVELFVDQLLEYLGIHNKEAHILRVRLRLPPEPTFTVRRLVDEVRLHFRLNPQEPLRKALAAHKQPTPDRKRFVLLLDWGIRGTADTHRISTEALKAWVELCATQLCDQCPPDMRLLAVLTLQSPVERHLTIETLVKQLRADARFSKRAFTMEELRPLGDVHKDDLNVFLKDEHTSCPKNLLKSMPELIWRKTQGRFKDTVDLIEKAESVGERGWEELYEDLKDLPPLPSESSSKGENELL